MATNMVGTRIATPGALVDIRFNVNSGASPLSATLITASASNSAMDTQLATLNAGYYTAAKLQQENSNDKLYALRLGYDAAGVG